MALSRDQNGTTLTMDVNLNDIRPLANLETYSFLKRRMESKEKVRAQQTILYTGLKYLNEKSPCSCQTFDEVRSFVASMRKFKLSKLELLALINNCPTTQVELSVMIPDLDTRFTMSQIEDMIAQVALAFPQGVEKASGIMSSGVSDESAQ